MDLQYFTAMPTNTLIEDLQESELALKVEKLHEWWGTNRHMMCNDFMSLNNIQLLGGFLPNFHPMPFPVCHFNSKTEKVHFKALTWRNICIKPFLNFMFG